MNNDINFYFCDIDGTLIETPKYILKRNRKYKDKILLDDPYNNLNCFQNYNDYVEFYLKYIYEYSFELKISEYIKKIFNSNPFTSFLISSFPRYYIHTELKNHLSIRRENFYTYIKDKNYKNEKYNINLKPKMIGDCIKQQLPNIKDKHINIFIIDDDISNNYINEIEQILTNLNINFKIKPILIKYNYSNVIENIFQVINYDIWFDNKTNNNILSYFI